MARARAAVGTPPVRLVGEPHQPLRRLFGQRDDVAERHVERGAEFSQQRSRRTALRPLHPPDHGPADAGARGKLIQRHAGLRPKRLQATTDRAIEFLLVHFLCRSWSLIRTLPTRGSHPSLAARSLSWAMRACRKRGANILETLRSL